MKRPSEAAGGQSIEELQRRYQQLHTRKIQAETNLSNANRHLDELKADAREKYGTDDLAELQSKLAALKAENEEKRAAYQASLDQIDVRLKQVEQDFAAAADPGEAAN